MTSPNLATGRTLIPASLPLAAAIGVFGVIYGATARSVLGPGLAVLSSLLVFSGAAQFTMIALLAAGAGVTAVLGGVAVLGLRHLPLGALLRPRLDSGRRQRAFVSLFLLDETAGLALTRSEPPERTLIAAGAACYAAWVLGTVGGVAGASVATVEPLAEALFPVLFIGLAALTASTCGDGARSVLAAAATLGLLVLVPAAGALGAVAAALLVATVVTAR